MRKLLVTALIAAVPATGFSASLDDTVDARRGYYSVLGNDMGALVAMVKGEVEYDGAAAATRAENMLTLTRYNSGVLFTPGTSNADMPGKTRALPKIWEDQDLLMEKGAAFVQAVEKLNDVAGLDKAELGKAVQELGGTCKGCHDNFRAKDF